MLPLNKAVTILRVSQVILGIALLGVISCSSSAPADNGLDDSQIYYADQIQQFQRLKAHRERQKRIEREYIARTRAENLEAWLALQYDDREAERLGLTREQVRNANRRRSLKTHTDEWLRINR